MLHNLEVTIKNKIVNSLELVTNLGLAVFAGWILFAPGAIGATFMVIGITLLVGSVGQVIVNIASYFPKKDSHPADEKSSLKPAGATA